MNTSQIEIVQSTFASVVPIADQAAEAFYANLFDIAPELRSMFPDDLSGQRKKLVAALAMAIANLRNVEVLKPKLMDLGRRHAMHYGVLPMHYDVVGQALIETLASAFGDDWTAEIETAWVETYALVSTTMKAGGEGLQWVA